MGLKKYIIFSLLLVVATYVFAFSLETGEYTVTALEQSVTLPIAIWIVAPASLLFLVTLLHIIFYGFKNYLQVKAVARDEDNLSDFLKDVLLENNSSKRFKLKALQELSSILSQMNIEPKGDSFTSSNEEINKVVQNIIAINGGEYVVDKSVKFNKTGSMTEKNLVNRLKTDVDYCIDIVKKSDNFSPDIVKIAFKKVLLEKTMTTIKKLLEGLKLDKEMVVALVEKDSESPDFALEHSAITKYAKDVGFKKDDYLNLAKLYKKSVQPDALIKMFEDISNENEEAVAAYLVVLFEYEMIDQIREMLNAYPENEYIPFRALLDLKDSGKNYSLDTLCYTK